MREWGNRGIGVHPCFAPTPPFPHSPTPLCFSRSARRAFAAAARAFVVVALQQQRRHRPVSARLVDGHKRQERAAGQLALAGEAGFREHLDLHLHRRRERRVHPRAQDDQVAHRDRMQELQVVDGRRHNRHARVAKRRNRARHVDQVHHRAAQDEPQRVGVVGQDDVDGFGEGVGGRLGCHPIIAGAQGMRPKGQPAPFPATGGTRAGRTQCAPTSSIQKSYPIHTLNCARRNSLLPPTDAYSASSHSRLNVVRHAQSKWMGKPSAKVSRPKP